MRRWWIGVLLPVVVVAGLTPMARRTLHAEIAQAASSADLSLAKVAPVKPPPLPPSFAGMDLAHIGLDDAGASAALPDRRTARLTVEPAMQRAAAALMTMHRLPEASIVLMDVPTGRILAYASHIEKGPARDLCAEATAPAASVFKVVTGAALVETAGLGPETRECYSGGEQRIMPADLEPDPQRDRWCTTLGAAMGRSVNTVFARLALRHVKPAALEEIAHGFGFGAPVPFDVPVQASTIKLPEDNLGYARTAAGFWNTTLSPLHAAWLSSIVARGGEPIRPTIVSDVADSSGATVYTASASPTLRRAILPETAQAVTTMMERTVSEGTSFRAFHDAKGKAFITGITVAGKTGTLTDASAQRFYTWFTGFAPSHPAPGQKQVAIGVLVVNQPTWHVKANVLAREMLRAYFADKTPATNR